MDVFIPMLNCQIKQRDGKYKNNYSKWGARSERKKNWLGNVEVGLDADTGAILIAVCNRVHAKGDKKRLLKSQRG